MSTWIRNLTLGVVLGAWLAVVVVSLVKGELPDYRVLGVPAALVLALTPSLRRGKKDDPGDGEDES